MPNTWCLFLFPGLLLSPDCVRMGSVSGAEGRARPAHGTLGKTELWWMLAVSPALNYRQIWQVLNLLKRLISKSAFSPLNAMSLARFFNRKYLAFWLKNVRYLSAIKAQNEFCLWGLFASHELMTQHDKICTVCLKIFSCACRPANSTRNQCCTTDSSDMISKKYIYLFSTPNRALTTLAYSVTKLERQ